MRDLVVADRLMPGTRSFRVPGQITDDFGGDGVVGWVNGDMLVAKHFLIEVLKQMSPG